MANYRIERGYADEAYSLGANGEKSSTRIPYFLFNYANSSDDAYRAVAAIVKEAIPGKVDGLWLKSVDVEERINESTWKVVAAYAPNDAKEKGEATPNDDVDSDGNVTEYGNEEPATTFDTTGGTKHINKSLSTLAKFPADAPDYGGAIEVDGDGNVNGVDVTMPIMQFAETHYLKPAKVTIDFKKRLFTLTGTVNDSAFRGFAAGEVLFLGVSGRRTGNGADDLWELTYSFSVSPNASSVAVGGKVGNIGPKGGWDYLWIKMGESVKNGKVTKEAVAAYVEKVYATSNFAQLGINQKEK